MTGSLDNPLAIEVITVASPAVDAAVSPCAASIAAAAVVLALLTNPPTKLTMMTP